MPAIRPHQKTRLHLRDSATVDFGPEGQTLTNDSVTVTDDVFTFTPPSRIDAATTFPTSAFSFSLWYKVDQTGTGTQRIIGDRDGTTGLDFYFGAGASGTVNLDIYDGSGFRALVNAMVRDGEWHHLVAGRTDAGDLFGYLDGVALTPSGTLSHTASTGSAITVGSFPGNSASSPYKGDIADIRVVDYALTAGEVFDLYNEGRGFDLPERKELKNTRLHLLDGLTDAGFYGSESVNTGITYENGVYGGFGGTNNLRVSADTVSGYDDQLSFAAWIKPTSYGPVPGGFGRICSKGPDELEIITIGGSGQPADSLQIGVNGGSDIAAGILTQGAWQHLAVSITSNVASVYINGALVDTLSVGVLANASSDLGIGNRIDGSSALARGFIGDMADIHYSHNALTAGDVANLYRKSIPALRGPEVLRIDPARYSGSGDLIDQTGGGNDAELQGTAAVTGGVLTLDGTDQCHARVPATNIGLEKGTIVARMRFGLSGDDTEGTAFLWDTDDARIALYRNGASRNELRMFVDDRYRDFDPHEWDADTTYTVAMVYEKATDTLQLYWDGVAIAGETNQGTWGSTALGTYFRIGASISGTGNLTAEYDWLNVYDEVLTADQIAYLSAKGNADPFPVPFGNLGGETLSIQPSRYTGSGDLVDQSGNGNDLTLPSGYSVADGVISSNGSANGPGFPGVDMSSNPGSIGFWIKTTDATVICVDGDGIGYCMSVQDGNTGTAISAVTNGQHYVDTVAIADNRDTLHAAISDGEWHHFAFTGDFDSNFGAIDSLFGFGGSSGARLLGEVDDIRIDNTRKWSAEEIKVLASARGVELPNVRDAKLAVLPSYDTASDGSTSNVVDYSGNTGGSGQVAILNTVDWTPDTANSGRTSLAYASSDYMQASAQALTGTLRQFSYFGWLRTADIFSRRTIIGQHGNAGGYGWRIYFNTNGSIRLDTSVDGTVLVTRSTTNVFDDDGWHPIAVTYDAVADVCNIWVDGAIDSTFSGLSDVFDNGLVTRMGLTNGGGDAMNGRHDDQLLYDRILTPAEIARFSERRNIFGEPYVAPPPPDPPSGGFTGFRSLINSCKRPIITGIRI